MTLVFLSSSVASAARWDLRKLAVDVRASSEEADLRASHSCDGNSGSRWSSDFSDRQWIQMKFQKAAPIDEVEIWWEAAYGADYTIDVSDDGTTWKTVHAVKDGKGGHERHTFEAVAARYLRLSGTRRGTEWGYSIFEWLARGELDEPEPEYGGFLKAPPPPVAITIYDHNRAELDPYFADLLAKDPPTSAGLSDAEFLDLIQRRAFDYYWYEVHPKSLFPVDSLSWRTATSTASVGFALAAYVVGHEREYRPREEIYERVEKLVDHVWDDPRDPNDLHIEHMSGHPYHWTNIETGRWEKIEGIITHDSMKLFCGMILIKHYFKGTKAGDIAAKYIDAIDWPWLIHAAKDRPYLGNFFTRDSDPSGPGDVIMYDGMKLDYIIPIGAEKGVAPYFWHNWAMSYPWDDYKGHFWRIERPAIWIHQWDNVWFDFGNLRDDYADYDQNSIEATLANRQWCIDNGTYTENFWGINPSAGPGPGGGELYGNFGAPTDELPFQNGAGNDGTISPTSAIPSIIFTPKESIAVARYLYDTYKDRLWGRYGFYDAINPNKNWVSKNVIGIDQGPIIANIENYRTGLIWKYFGMEEMVWRGLDRCGFVGVIDNFDPSEHSHPYAEWAADERVQVTVQSDESREAGRALRVAYDLSSEEPAAFVAQPARVDFSHWRYLAFWQKGGPELRVTIPSGDAAVELAKVADVAADGGWRRVYYALPEEARGWTISEVRFYVPGPGKGEFFLDAIDLTNQIERSPAPSMLEDFEDHSARKEVWTDWNTNPGLRPRRAQDVKRGGRQALKVEVDKSSEDQRWAYVSFKPRIRDWRKAHSVSMWVYGQAEILLKLTDASGKSNDAWKARSEKEGEWNRVVFNIQRNSDPKKPVWDGRLYDKQNISDVLLFIEPDQAKAKKTIYIDDVVLID